jgi:hypothetical protein
VLRRTNSPFRHPFRASYTSLWAAFHLIQTKDAQGPHLCQSAPCHEQLPPPDILHLDARGWRRGHQVLKQGQENSLPATLTLHFSNSRAIQWQGQVDCCRDTVSSLSALLLYILAPFSAVFKETLLQRT